MQYSGENLVRFYEGGGRARRDPIRGIVRSATITGRVIKIESTTDNVFRWEYRPRRIKLAQTLAMIAAQGSEGGSTKILLGAWNAIYGSLGGIPFPKLPPNIQKRVVEAMKVKARKTVSLGKKTTRTMELTQNKRFTLQRE